jgi:hypothetical protein
MGLGPMAMASVSAECGRNHIAPVMLTCQVPDEGNMHTLLHHLAPEQKAPTRSISAAIARHVMEVFRQDGSTRRATGLGLLY